MKQLADLHIFEALQQHADGNQSMMSVFNADAVVVENGIAETIGRWAGKVAAVPKKTVAATKTAAKDAAKGFSEGYTEQKPSRMFNPTQGAKGDTNTLSQNGLLSLALGYVNATIKSSTGKVAKKYNMNFNQFPGIVQAYKTNYAKVKNQITKKVRTFAADVAQLTANLSKVTVTACEKAANSGVPKQKSQATETPAATDDSAAG